MEQKTNKNFINENWIVCYLDILGYGKLVKTLFEHSDKVADFCNSIQDIIKESVQKFNGYKGKGQNIYNHIRFQILSDSILIMLSLHNLPICDDKISSDVSVDENIFRYIFGFLLVVTYSYLNIASKIGYLLRGAIAIGPHYQSELDKPENQFIFSKALVIVSELEKEAVYPRILIDKSLKILLDKDAKLSLSSDYGISRDFDGLYTLNIFNFLGGTHKKEKEMLRNLHNAVKMQIKNNNDKTKIIRKFYYYSVKYNEYVKDKYPNDIDLILDLNNT